MRITGGRARGIVLKIPARGTLRPATGYLREAVFSSLGARVASARVLDLFAGTGAYGLEAVSRGATHATCVDANAAAVIAIRANLAAVAKAMGVAGPDALGRASEGDVFSWQPPARNSIWCLWTRPTPCCRNLERLSWRARPRGSRPARGCDFCWKHPANTSRPRHRAGC